MKITTKNENARCAIVTKYAGPSNSRGSRILVSSRMGRKSFPYPHELSGADVYAWAVSEYLAGFANESWGSISDYSVGVIPSGEYVFVSNK